MDKDTEMTEEKEKPKAPTAIGLTKKSDTGPTPLKESELKSLKDEYEASIEYQKADGRLDRWHEHNEYLNCRWKDEDDDEDDSVDINSIWMNAQTEIPDLYFRQPEVTLEAEDDYFSTKIGGYDLDMDNLQACKLFGIKLNNVVKNMRVEPIWERLIMGAIAPYGLTIGKVGFALTTEAPWTGEYDLKTSYWFRMCDTRNITFDVYANNYTELTLIFEQFTRLRNDLLDSKLYFENEVKEMKKVVPSDEHMPQALKKRFSKLTKKFDPELVTGTEVHDMKNRCIRWIDFNRDVPTEIRKPIRRDRWFEGSDYIMLSLNCLTDDNLYPLSDVEPVVDQAKSRNRNRAAMDKHVREWGTTFIFPEGEVPIGKINDIAEVRDRLFIGLPRKAIDGIKIQNPPPISGDWYRIDEMDRRDNAETLGLPDYLTERKKQTATHDVLEDNKYSKRINRRRRRIQLAILEMYRKVAGLIQEYDRGDSRLNVSKYVEDTEFMDFLKEISQKRGDKRPFDPKRPFITASKEWWQGEYGFDYAIEEQLDRPKAVQVQQLATTVNAITANPFLNRALFDKPTTSRKLVQKFFEMQGFNLEEFKERRGTGKLDPSLENEIVEAGDPQRGVDARDLPMPIPHDDDRDAEHIVGHYRLMREMQEALAIFTQNPPKNEIEVQTMAYLEKSIQKLQRHMMLHDLNMKQKEEKDAMAFGPGGPQRGPKPGPQGMNPETPNEPVAPNQGNLMGGGRTLV